MSGPRSTSLPELITPEIMDGSHLAGDDFEGARLKRWFLEEQEAFFKGDSGNSDKDPWYAYMRYVNRKLGFSHVKKRKGRASSMLILGPGSGSEVEDFAKENPNCRLHFLEASENFQQILRDRFPDSTIVVPHYSGEIDLADSTQDLVCSFSVLHHIPNVSKVMKEIGRITRRGGFLMVREPCSSMGDWRGPRSATPNERGISRSLITTFAERAGFLLERSPVPIIFEPLNKFLKKFAKFNRLPFPVLYVIDRIISRILSYNDHYWRNSFYKKLGPSSYFYLFIKIDSPPGSNLRQL